MINLKIKEMGADLEGNPRFATGKLWVRPGDEYPPMEPGDIIEFGDSEGKAWLKSHAEYLEVTFDDPTRPSPDGKMASERKS